MTRSLTLAVLFALASCLARVAATQASQQPAPRTHSSRPERPREFQRAGGTPADSPKAFDFTLGHFNYRVTVNGNGSRTKGDDVRRFALNFGPGEEIRYLYYAKYEGGLVLTCETLGEYGGTSYAVRLDQPSMRARWTTNLPATETGEPSRDGSRLYVTGKSFAGALDLEKGELLWYVDKFPGRKGEFDSFDAPEPRGREVLFRTRPVYNGAAKTVVVDSRKGKIIRVE